MTDRNTARIDTFEAGFVHELSDLLSAERQITKALPEMMKWASHDELRKALEQHLKETEQQVSRLEQAFKSLERRPQSTTCPAMEGIIREAREMAAAATDPDVRDAFVIAAAQKVEHYEIASYGTVVTWAERLGFEDAAQLLRQTLDEEKRADETLTKIAESTVNADARR